MICQSNLKSTLVPQGRETFGLPASIGWFHIEIGWFSCNEFFDKLVSFCSIALIIYAFISAPLRTESYHQEFIQTVLQQTPIFDRWHTVLCFDPTWHGACIEYVHKFEFSDKYRYLCIYESRYVIFYVNFRSAKEIIHFITVKSELVWDKKKF